MKMRDKRAMLYSIIMASISERPMKVISNCYCVYIFLLTLTDLAITRPP